MAWFSLIKAGHINMRLPAHCMIKRMLCTFPSLLFNKQATQHDSLKILQKGFQTDFIIM